MNRRNFIKTSSLILPMVAFGAKGTNGAQQNKKPLIIDGMGEIRLKYPMSLIDEILESGINAVRITLGDPILHGAEAFDNAIKEIA